MSGRSPIRRSPSPKRSRYDDRGRHTDEAPAYRSRRDRSFSPEQRNYHDSRRDGYRAYKGTDNAHPSYDRRHERQQSARGGDNRRQFPDYKPYNRDNHRAAPVQMSRYEGFNMAPPRGLLDDRHDDDIRADSFQDLRRLKRIKLWESNSWTLWRNTPSPPPEDDDTGSEEAEEPAVKASQPNINGAANGHQHKGEPGSP
eukprot:jgi/Chrzof1/12554/UNPLg00506.t1